MKGPAAIAALLLVSLLVGAVAFFVQRQGGVADCSDTVIAESLSPGGRWVAALFARRCGGTAESTQVALRRAGAAFAPLDADVIFIAAGREDAKISWVAEPESVVVETNARSVVREHRSWRKVGVQVRRVR